jgi:hypothetical protein
MARGKKHTPEQIVNVLRQVEVSIANGKTTPAACREGGNAAGIPPIPFCAGRDERPDEGKEYSNSSKALRERTLHCYTWDETARRTFAAYNSVFVGARATSCSVNHPSYSESRPEERYSDY